MAARLTRRDWLRVGAVGLGGGLALPDLFRLRAGASVAAIAPKAKSVIVLFLSGGPAHQDTWDMKPDAPEAIRGTFRPIDTNVPGIQICEHLPRMARIADKYAILRAVHHRESGHPAAAYWMMAGAPIERPAPDASFMSRLDRPHAGSALARMIGPAAQAMPPFVMLPEAMAPNGPERAGQHAGFLGPGFDPYRINSDPNLPDYSPGVVAPPPELSPARLRRRRALLDGLDGPDDDAAFGDDLDPFQARAFDLLGSAAARDAFDIAKESPADRDRYGRHAFGQSTLLARRMVEAGVRLVHVNWVRHDNGKGGSGYDTHGDHLSLTRNNLLPPTDAAFSSLIEDLDARGLLDETLVVMMGEFGRTPRFNDAAGRDHWPYCFSVVMAGGGIQGGRVHGSSDRIAAYPASDPVSPGDVFATLYHLLGVDPRTPIRDAQGRPHVLADGEPIRALL
ncbi:DUF1501 domain-containing protein [Tundrisphaera sp. TA3]|uniref:DUF1501 domain-containing protein n=1 Tax=Tundrisphaera sp. TA3 TaxID=3435775 RepID=UPI003EBF2355